MAIERNPDWDQETADAEFATLATAATASSARSAEQIFRASASAAAQAIVDLSLSAVNERTRLDASKYIIDRVMGRVAERGFTDGDENKAPWDDIYGTTVVREPSATQRAQGAAVTAHALTRSRLQPPNTDEDEQ